MRAVHTNIANHARRQACDKNLRGCPGCYSAPNPNLLATCEQGACVAVDLSRTSIVHCSKDEDCKLRVASCRECSSSAERPSLLAIGSSRETAYQKLVCDGKPTFSTCEPAYPKDFRAHCVDEHCVARQYR